MSPRLPAPISLTLLAWIGVGLGTLGTCGLPSTAVLKAQPGCTGLALVQFALGVVSLGLQLTGFVGALRGPSGSRGRGRGHEVRRCSIVLPVRMPVVLSLTCARQAHASWSAPS